MAEQYRLLVTGGRNFSDKDLIFNVFEYYTRRQSWRPDPIRLISGGARGADAYAEYAAEGLGWDIELHPADWATHGRAAGGIRNQRMVDLGANICIAFPDPDSVGTWDCVKRAVAAGIRVEIPAQSRG